MNHNKAQQATSLPGEEEQRDEDDASDDRRRHQEDQDDQNDQSCEESCRTKQDERRDTTKKQEDAKTMLSSLAAPSKALQTGVQERLVAVSTDMIPMHIRQETNSGSKSGRKISIENVPVQLKSEVKEVWPA